VVAETGVRMGYIPTSQMVQKVPAQAEVEYGALAGSLWSAGAFRYLRAGEAARETAEKMKAVSPAT